MKKKFVVFGLAFSMLISSTSLSFAATDVMCQQANNANAKSSVAMVENVVGLHDMITNVSENEENYIAEVEGFDVSIPKDGGDSIEAELDTGEKFSMLLPKEVANSEGVLTKDATVVYDSNQESVTFLVQATENDVDSGEKECGVRTMIVIDDSTAPKDYSFKFELPKGSKFTRGDELKTNEIGDDEIAIVDAEGFISGIIKSPWAKDANGKSLETFYKLDGNVLIQHIEFDETTCFPVIADPWYGTSSQTENIGSPIEQDFTAYAAGQPTKGFYFENGGYISYTPGNNTSASVSISLGVGYGSATVSVGIGIATSGASVSASYPVPKKAGWYKLKVTETYNVQKYKIMRRWKDSDTGRVTWKEYSRNAKVVGERRGIAGKIIEQ